jgi:hypothetical protein
MHPPDRLRALSSTEIQVEMRAPLLFNSGMESAFRCELRCFSVSLDPYKRPLKQKKLLIKKPISLKLSIY